MGRRKDLNSKKNEKNFDDLTKHIIHQHDIPKPEYMKQRRIGKKVHRYINGQDCVRVYDNVKCIGFIRTGYSERIYIRLIAMNGVKYIQLVKRYFKSSKGVWVNAGRSINIPIRAMVPIENSMKVNPKASGKSQYEHYLQLDKPPEVLKPVDELMSWIPIALKAAENFEIDDPDNAYWLEVESNYERRGAEGYHGFYKGLAAQKAYGEGYETEFNGIEDLDVKGENTDD